MTDSVGDFEVEDPNSWDEPGNCFSLNVLILVRLVQLLDGELIEGDLDGVSRGMLLDLRVSDVEEMAAIDELSERDLV